MAPHLASSNEVRRIIRDESGSIDRAATVEQMALTLVAGVEGGLNTANTMDVAECLTRAPEEYQAQTINNHVDEALALAKTMLDAMEENRFRRQMAALNVEMSKP
ncbi:hypothetical protein [Tardiphaga sp.]|uniref:hypothetical protein n=1 Tax=Tardiphaga sp. TaxID=1926292 RepID=UPI002621ADE6|nr:hypothetical protein [Tardiphaga sp.]MDB5618537.1 hypothetical protein [Tardiphaga sp.]